MLIPQPKQRVASMLVVVRPVPLHRSFQSQEFPAMPIPLAVVQKAVGLVL